MRRPNALPATLWFGLLAASLLSLALAAAPAGADQVYVATETIAPTGVLALNNPTGIAIDNSAGPSAGDIYVSDTSNHRVIKFDPTGKFLLMWGREVNEGSGNPSICTNAGSPTDICQLAAGGNGPGQLSQPSSIAVDPSSGPSAGDVYVIGDSGNAPYIQKFDPSGQLVTSWGGTPFGGAIEGTGVPGGPFQYGFGGLTVDQSGNLAVFQASEARVFQFAEDGTGGTSFTTCCRGSQGCCLAADPEGNFYKTNGDSSIEKFNSGEDVGQVGTTTAGSLAYSAATNDLFALVPFPPGIARYRFNGSGQVVESDLSTCTPAPFVGCPPTEEFGTADFATGNGAPSGIAVNATTGKVYAVDTAGKSIKVFSTIDLPIVITGAASNVTRDAAKLLGNVDQDGAGDVTSCSFEYGQTTAYSLGSIPCEQALPLSSPESVSAQLPPESLEAATTYHYRFSAGNAAGARKGLDKTFTTPPAVDGVSTDDATDIERLTATLNGSFNGDGVDTSFYFEYGPTANYGLKTADVDHGTAAGPQSVSAGLAELNSYSTYHFRLVAHNKYGTTVGADKTLLTAPPDPPAVERTFSSDVTDSSATIHADIDTGLGLTVYRFDYGILNDYGSRTLVAGPIEPGSLENTASAELFELEPGTTYHFRVLATNLAGTTVGPDQTFTTQSAPVVDGESASAVTESTATVSATINPGLSNTTFHVEYGPTSTYGLNTRESGQIGSDESPHVVSSQLSGLAPGRAYHFRIVATNAIGTTYGTDQSFTTSTPLQAQPPVQAQKCKKGFVKKHGKCVRKKPKAKKKKERGHG